LLKEERRIGVPTTPCAWSYEATDTKLAVTPKVSVSMESDGEAKSSPWRRLSDRGDYLDIGGRAPGMRETA